ncbi:RNA-directed DNA polymerase (plasmid) [Paraburkholderia strydomiana]
MANKSQKYAALAPRIEYISDIVVLSQAWKKTHTYIRYHNWYADTLELDCSAVNLERKLSEWARDLRDGRYKPSAARLVPAPKSEQWLFDETLPDGWAPEAPAGERFLRPLAHVGIREQTIATAAMLCLADCVESAQGDTSLSPEAALAAGVFSYGNRLYCSWSRTGNIARFPWGNSDIYSRYFQDYQSFVERPLAIAQAVTATGKTPSTLFVVKLDLSAFYDNINIPSLVMRLKMLYGKFRTKRAEAQASGVNFWATLESALSIRWQDEDVKWAPFLKRGKLPSGLPQGLVASGFFANAYLIDFDEAVGKSIRTRKLRSGNLRFRLHDYCRYVDDLRLVISCDEELPSDVHLRVAVTQWIQSLLDETANDDSFPERLTVNEKKTEVESFASLGGESGTAARMKSLQSQLSGPFDIAALQHVEAGLNGLLAQAELGMSQRRPIKTTVDLPALASVARPKLEVRDDTLTRFAAYRLTKALRLRRSMTDLTQEDESGLAKSVLLHDFEVAARRLVAAWSFNPGLAQVLIYGLDLFPSPELLRTVTDALLLKVSGETRDAYSTGVALYTLAQLFRIGASQTGQRSIEDSFFKVGDALAYRDELGKLAKSLLDQGVLPWYVKQQAVLLLASLGQRYSVLPGDEGLEYHRCLQEFLGGL